MKAISGKDFAKLLERRGWILQRVNGSHHIYSKEGNPARVSLPVHRNLPLKVGLQKHLNEDRRDFRKRALKVLSKNA